MRKALCVCGVWLSKHRAGPSGMSECEKSNTGVGLFSLGCSSIPSGQVTDGAHLCQSPRH